MIAARAIFDGPAKVVHVRVARHGDDTLYLDLCNDPWEAVEITASGWHIVLSQAVPVKFVRKDNAAPLPYPTRGGTVEILRRFLNVETDEDFGLFVAWVIGTFNADGPYTILVLQGEQGSAKSITVRVARSITDAAVEPLRAPPRSERDLAIAASGNWTPELDNLSGIRPWLSDALCRLATGGGFATRELYSDDREVIFSQKRPVILNGIDSLAVAGDLRGYRRSERASRRSSATSAPTINTGNSSSSRGPSEDYTGDEKRFAGDPYPRVSLPEIMPNGRPTGAADGESQSLSNSERVEFDVCTQQVWSNTCAAKMCTSEPSRTVSGWTLRPALMMKHSGTRCPKTRPLCLGSLGRSSRNSKWPTNEG
jgi:hypothetical protein